MKKLLYGRGLYVCTEYSSYFKGLGFHSYHDMTSTYSL